MKTGTYREEELKGRKLLEEAGVEDAQYDAHILMLSVCGCDRAHWPLLMDDPATDERKDRFHELIGRRAKREPLQQILHSAPFFGREFYVERGVLVPRFDTETLIEAVLPHLQSGMRILDLCTGSGCIVLTLLLEGPEGLSGMGTDISEEALSVAGKNRDSFKNELSAKGSGCVLLQSDLYDRLRNETRKEGAGFDVIVSNPPYIPSADIETLMAEVRDYEPRIALDGGPDGMAFYRRIIDGSTAFLKDGGLMALECGYDQTDALSELMEKAGFREVSSFYDNGGNPRLVTGFLAERAAE